MLLANIRGIVTKVMKRIDLTILVDLIEKAMNIDDDPTLSKNIAT